MIIIYIGLIDSGEGGLAFLNGIYSSHDRYCLIMDKAFFPYGDKSELFLIERSIYLCEYLFKKGVSKIILACNTLSLVALPTLKKIYKGKVSGVIELLDNIKANDYFLGNSLANKYIVKMYPYLNVIDGSKLIYQIENSINSNDEIKRIKGIVKKDRIILGCTHFIKIKKKFINYLSEDEEYLRKGLYNKK